MGTTRHTHYDKKELRNKLGREKYRRLTDEQKSELNKQRRAQRSHKIQGNKQ